jgi:hypothetical protein
VEVVNLRGETVTPGGEIRDVADKRVRLGRAVEATGDTDEAKGHVSLL